jgi:hypothetical protein
MKESKLRYNIGQKRHLKVRDTKEKREKDWMETKYLIEIKKRSY